MGSFGEVRFRIIRFDNGSEVGGHDWNIITIWEYDVSKSRIEETMARIVDELKANAKK